MSFEQDIKDMRRQLVAEISYTINTSNRLYLQYSGKSGKEIRKMVYEHADEHDGEFGPVLKPEFDVLNSRDWNAIAGSL